MNRPSPQKNRRAGEPVRATTDIIYRGGQHRQSGSARFSTGSHSFRLDLFDATRDRYELERLITAVLAQQGVSVSVRYLPSEEVPPPGYAPVLQRPASDSRRQVERTADRRGDATVLHWIADGILLPADELAQAWSLSQDALAAMLASGELDGFELDGQTWYCCELLKFTRAEYAAIHAALGSTDAQGKLVFLLRGFDALDGHRPGDAVLLGHLQNVVEMAREWASKPPPRSIEYGGR